MKSIDYIQSKLEKLFLDLPEIKIRYQYNKNTQTHLIEVLPVSLFETDEVYIDSEFEIEEEFESLFPGEEILFITKGSLSEITIPDFTWGYEHIIFDFENVINEDYFEFPQFSNETIDNCENLALAA